MITVIYSTRESKPEYAKMIKDTIGVKNVEVLEFVNNGEKSLSQVYNEGLAKAVSDICVLIHDDLVIETKNWGQKIIKHFNKTSYGILGLAGTKYLAENGKWWEVPHTMYGIVNHEKDGKKWESKYSADIGNKVEPVIIVDGLFIMVDKKRIKHRFDESYAGFHFYDLSFCFPNFLDGVTVGVITDIRVTHLSIGETNDKWEDNRAQFAEQYKANLPMDIHDHSEIETFIICHDQDIILEYEKNNKFYNIQNYKYILVGNGPIDDIEGHEKVIVARNLEHNIEQYPNFTALTGWYAIWKNKLAKGKVINLFEYDIITEKFIQQRVHKIFKDPNFGVLGYIPATVNMWHFIDNPVWVQSIFKGIKEVYKVDLERSIRIFMGKNKNAFWLSTSNVTMSMEEFNGYMKWFEPLIPHLQDDRNAGHAFERSITFYCLMYRKTYMFFPNLLKHYQMDSHKTQGHFVDTEGKLRELTANGNA